MMNYEDYLQSDLCQTERGTLFDQAVSTLVDKWWSNFLLWCCRWRSVMMPAFSAHLLLMWFLNCVSACQWNVMNVIHVTYNAAILWWTGNYEFVWIYWKC